MKFTAAAKSPTSLSDSTGTRVWSSPELIRPTATLRLRNDPTVAMATNTEMQGNHKGAVYRGGAFVV